MFHPRLAGVDDAPLQLVPSEPIRAGLLHGVDGLRDAPIAATAGPGPRKGRSRATPDSLSHKRDKWALHLLQRGRSEGRADASLAARISLFIADCMSSEHFGQLAWQFKRMSGSSGLKVQAAIAC